MKSILQFPIVASLLLLIAPAMISAFITPPPTNNNFARLSVKVSMAEKPAKSKEEDLELTRSIIMSHIASSDDLVVDDDADDDDDDGDDDDDESPSSPSPVSKIKSAGKKIKDKVKSKLSKD